MVRRPRRSTRFPYATLFRSTASAASVTVNSATSITATVPAGAPVTSKINVTTPGGTATSNSDFTLDTAPTITSFTPTSGPVGTTVTINGTNFISGATVKFGTVSATNVSVVNSTKITADVPVGAPASDTISVTTKIGRASCRERA